jgi:hypothetical protein
MVTGSGFARAENAAGFVANHGGGAGLAAIDA